MVASIRSERDKESYVCPLAGCVCMIQRVININIYGSDQLVFDIVCIKRKAVCISLCGEESLSRFSVRFEMQISEMAHL